MNEGIKPYEGPGWTRMPFEAHEIHFRDREVPGWKLGEAYIVFGDEHHGPYKGRSLTDLNAEADRLRTQV